MGRNKFSIKKRWLEKSCKNNVTIALNVLPMLKTKKYILLTPVPKNGGGGLNKREGLADNFNKQRVQIKVGEGVDPKKCF